MLHQSSTLSAPVESDRLAGLSRLIRRICLLREQGEGDAATRLQAGDLAADVRDFRQQHPSVPLSDEDVQAMFVREGQRVTEAVLLTDLLVPQLLGRLAGSAPVSGAAVAPARPAGESRATQRVLGPGSPAIPDLLDAMLAAERSNRRPPAAHPSRA